MRTMRAAEPGVPYSWLQDLALFVYKKLSATFWSLLLLSSHKSDNEHTEVPVCLVQGRMEQCIRSANVMARVLQANVCPALGTWLR